MGLQPFFEGIVFFEWIERSAELVEGEDSGAYAKPLPGFCQGSHLFWDFDELSGELFDKLLIHGKLPKKFVMLVLKLSNKPSHVGINAYENAENMALELQTFFSKNSKYFYRV